MTRKPSPYECNVCETEKKGTNHWLVIDVSRDGFHLHTWEWALNEGTLDSEGRKHICGQGCAHKMLEDFLSKIQSVAAK